MFGDAGNPATWPFPVRFRVVPNASPRRVVRDRAEGLVEAFIEAGRLLADDGAAGITTTCGFLCLHQSRIADALPVPFVSSSLLQAPLVARLLASNRRIGIITVEAASLSADHLRAAGIDAQTPVCGLPRDSVLARVLLEDLPELDAALSMKEMLDAGHRLVATHPDVGAIVLECANMGPYAHALAAALQIPVYDWYSMLAWFAQGLYPRAFLAQAAMLAAPRTAH